jgi:hypothetical protein
MQAKKGIFVTLVPKEIQDLIEKIRTKRPQMIGVKSNGMGFKFQAVGLEPNGNFMALVEKASDWSQLTGEFTFNLIFNNNKYFLKANVKPVNKEERSVQLILATEIHRVHRRAQERLIIPDEFYAVLKILNINGKLDKSFARILNLSSSGNSIEVKGELALNAKDKIMGELSVPSKPPIEVECEVVHRQESTDKDGKKILVFGIKYSFKKDHQEEVMKTLVNDLYRDIFENTKKAS